MNFKYKILSVFVVGALFSGVSLSVKAEELVDPSSISGVVAKGVTTPALLERVLSADSEEKRYLGVVGFIDNYGQWLTVSPKDQEPVIIHVTSYLLQKGHEDVATALLKNGVTKGWFSYKFADGVANDFIFALQNGQLSYLKTLFQDFPEGLNSEMMIAQGASKVLPLAILATSEYVKVDFYKEILSDMLSYGANPQMKMANGLTSLTIASSSNNMTFVRVVQDYLGSQGKGFNSLMKNTPLSSDELIEMQAIADVFIEKSKEEKASYPYDKLHEMWVQMILKGYNVAADIIFDELSTRKDFDIEKRVNNGLSPMMAAVMSPLYGGNVEYAQRLFDEGADPSILIDVPTKDGEEPLSVNYIQLSLGKDNYKSVAFMLSKGVNFVTTPGDDSVFILTEAMEQKSYLSAVLLKEALMSSVKNLPKKVGSENGSKK